MKKLDLHIHTVPTVSDHTFVFSLERLKQYVAENCIDAIAITNHNLFDRMQYESICTALDITVFPGIEVDLANGHLLVITDANDLDDFDSKCSHIYTMNGASSKSSISEDEFISIFPDYKKYLLIPHYDKSPKLSPHLVPTIQAEITCGEVSSARKFISMKKNTDEPVPVLFGDIRISDPIVEPQDRQTYIDIDELTLSAIKYALNNICRENHFCNLASRFVCSLFVSTILD